ncbi:MAG: TIM barrel protein [Planctomycetota bacterium]|nr:xylose isomerase [Planctomycetota bacterium]MEE3052986.1 TIM barrel protein [Planctomycetota bacterium]
MNGTGSRRKFLKGSAALAAGALLSSPASLLRGCPAQPGSSMKFGLVTYLWGQDWDLPTLIKNCTASKVLGVELRTTHAHKVEPSLNAAERKEVKKRFADSPVTMVGIGSNERYDNPNPAVVAKAVEATKAFIKLSHDVGGTGVKVKPDRFHQGVEKEKTIEQIGKALNQLGEYADGWGQEIRLEVHGQCSQLPTIRKIMDVAQNKNVGVCWNSNGQDLQGKGLVHNFDLVKKRFGATAHVRELEDKNYPYEKLMELFVKMDYAGWVMLEARGKPRDRVAALSQQLKLFNSMVANGRKALGKKG